MGTISEMTVRGNDRKIMDKAARSAVFFKGATYNAANDPVTNQITYEGITWTKISGNKVKVSGTATATSIFDFFSSENSLPEWAEQGGKYRWKLDAPANTVWVYIRIYTEERGETIVLDSYAGEGEFTLPDDCKGMIFRLGASSGLQINTTVKFDVFSGETNKELTNRINNDQVPLYSKDGIMLNGMQQYIESARMLSCNTEVGDSIYDESKWVKSAERISIAKRYITFDRDTLVESENDNIVFKMHECNTSGVIIREMGSWTLGFIAKAGVKYVFTMKHANDTIFSGSGEFKYITAAEIQNEYRITANIEKRSDAFAPYYSRFVRAGIADDPLDEHKLIFNYGSKTRRSCMFTMSRPVLLSMRNPDYSFRFYWFDASNVYHETAWGTLWETPVNVEVSMSIARRDDSIFGDHERPELYLEAWTAEEQPKEYFLNEIDDTVNKVNAAFTEPGLCFLLSTDHHTLSGQGSIKYDTVSDMVVNMKAVAKRIKVDGNIALGDIADFKVWAANQMAKMGITDLSYSNLDEVFYKWMDDAMVKLMSVHPNFYYVPGNHDDNRYINRDEIQASESAYDYSPGEIFSYYIGKGTHDVVYNTENNGLDYYVNFEQFKIRAFFIDANYYNATAQTSEYSYTKAWWYGFADETVEWMEEQLAAVPSGWSVVIFSHMSPIKEHNEDNKAYLNFDNVKSVIQTFINNGGDYIATIYGHTHGDWHATTPWPEMGFGAQKCENYNVTIENMPGIVWPQRTLGTATEDCWNVLMILPGSRKIKVIRFGAGSDQEYTY